MGARPWIHAWMTTGMIKPSIAYAQVNSLCAASLRERNGVLRRSLRALWQQVYVDAPGLGRLITRSVSVDN